MAKFIQLVPIKIDEEDGNYYIRFFTLDDAGDVWEFHYATMTQDRHWARIGTEKENG